MIQIAAPFGVKGDRQYVTPQFGKSNACNSALNANFAEGLRWQTIHPRPKCGQTETRSQATLQSVNDSAFSQLSYDPKNEDQELLKHALKPTLTVAVSGAAGQIAQHLLFMLASGGCFGMDQPIAFRLLASRQESLAPLEGMAMELEDSLYPLLRKVEIGNEPLTMFRDADWAVLLGAVPRAAGTERAHLLDINGQIYQEQGRALNEVASRDCKVLVVGNPCNTNALICMENAPRLQRRNFHALMRLDENRARCQLAHKAQRFYTAITNLCVWGNHSTTQVPDFLNAHIGGEPAMEVVQDEQWFRHDFTPTVAGRGGEIASRLERSPAASTAVAVADAVKSLVEPTAEGECFSSAVCTDGNPYGIREGLICSMPCWSQGEGRYHVCDDFAIDDWLREKILESEDELIRERECVSHLLPNAEPAACRIMRETSLPGES
ncbi:hypothetical protein CVIRNUC_002008 [Coccomyxa viridis]|uniref:malate dehydrogenase (NADP(+)) n=1 Tax=Coccomyxa viridis TaxID=1274662 RepID=A0AAV1HWG8_9CHLO|nr:hypothetical protein CVIRNUC_002008 [Coccomyxa viridis]